MVGATVVETTVDVTAAGVRAVAQYHQEMQLKVPRFVSADRRFMAFEYYSLRLESNHG
jgi:hypothetical protein